MGEREDMLPAGRGKAAGAGRPRGSRVGQAAAVSSPINLLPEMVSGWPKNLPARRTLMPVWIPPTQTRLI